MNYYEQGRDRTAKKHKTRQWKRESSAGGFTCRHCKWFVVINALMGTANRNHCNRCLWSCHVDETKGDRRATCQGGMEPIGLTYKHDGYGRQGEIMVIHLCSSCQKLSINRIARDDDEQQLVHVFEQSFVLGESIKNRLKTSGIYLLERTDSDALRRQLFGC